MEPDARTDPDDGMEPTDGRGTDPVGGALERAARRVDVPTAPIAREQVRRRAAQRTRRTRALTAVAAVAALGVGGVVVAVAVRNDDRPAGVSEAPISEPSDADPSTTDVTGTRGVTTDPSVTDPTSPEAVEVPSSDSVPSDTGAPVERAPVAAPWSGPVTQGEVIEVEASRSAAEVMANAGPVGWLVPWHDGFLASARPVQEQPLPAEFPAEISERFPQEVRDLFAEGLPATVQEAIEMLQEADLYDEVSEIVLADPEVYDAIYGDVQYTTLPDPEVYFSTDGAEWQQVDFALPPGFESNDIAASSGARLALLGSPPPSSADDDLVSRPILLASTTDLLTWEVVQVDSGVPAIDVPDTFDHYAWANSLSVYDDHWIVPVERSIEPRLDDFVPADMMRDGFGVETTSEGITVSAGNGTDPERISITWEELGAGPDLVEWLAGGLGSESLLVSGSWDDGTGTPSSSSRRAWSAVATADGYYALGGEAVEFSEDGTSWDGVPLPRDYWISSLFAINGRAVATLESSSEPGETRLFVLAGAEELPELVDLPLPPGASGVGSPPSADGAVILELWNEGGGERWVLAASPDGRWLIEDLPTGDGDYIGPAATARSGSTVLAYSEQEWFSYDLG